jgi:hypothetical protein
LAELRVPSLAVRQQGVQVALWRALLWALQRAPS